MSVSYTHLDVYKRQVLLRGRNGQSYRIWDTALQHGGRSLRDTNGLQRGSDKPSVRNASGAVSYTHLDVYKRQDGDIVRVLVTDISNDEDTVQDIVDICNKYDVSLEHVLDVV